MPRVVPEYKVEAKSRIIAAANQVFAEKGYRQATMDDVARKLGVSKGALYLYFSSKEELFEDICREEPTVLKDILYSTFSEGKDPLESASEFFEKMVGRYGPGGNDSGIFFEIFSEASRNPVLKRVLKKTQEEYADMLESFFNHLQEMGHLGKDVRLRPLTYAVIGLWNGIETLMVSGLSVAEAKQAWLEGFKAMFINSPLYKAS